MLYRHRLLVLLFALGTVTYLDRICISVAGPRIQAELGISPSNWGWVVASFAFGYALFEIPGGVMADRFGARRVLTRIVIWWSAFTSLTGMVSGLGGLLVVRFLFGAGEAGAFPGATSAIARWFPGNERSRAQGVLWMSSRVGAVLSPILVVPLQRAYGWRVSFHVFALLGIVWCVVWFIWYRDRPEQKRGITPEELATIGAGAPAPEHAGMPWRAAMRKATFWKLLFMFHAYAWAAYFYLSWLHTYLQKGWGMSEDQMRVWSSLPFVLGAIGNIAGGVLSDRLTARHGPRIGRHAVGATGLFIGAASLLVVALAKTPTVAAVALCIGFAGLDCFLPVAWAMALDLGGRNAGALSGAMNMAGQTGSFLTSVLFGYLVEHFGNYQTPLFPLAFMCAVSGIVMLRIDPTAKI